MKPGTCYYVPDALFDGVEFDRDVQHDSPVRTQVNRVYLQVHNRGPFSANNVTVKILWTDATAGLPLLPGDFWTSYPNDSGDTSIWHPVGSYQTIPVLEPARPVILSWNWTPPASAATHTCILAVIESPNDPIPASNKSLDVNWLIGNEKHIGLKNLHVIDAPPGPMPLPFAEIYFHNYSKKRQKFDFVIDRRKFPAEGKITLQFPKITTQKRLKKSFVAKEILLQKAGKRLRPPFNFQILAPKEAVIRNVVLRPGEKLRAKILFTIPKGARPGDRYRVTIMQRQGKRILGGSTYEIRIKKKRQQQVQR